MKLDELISPRSRRRLALHWKIVIGLVAGALFGGIANAARWSLNMVTAREKLGVSERVTSFVLPLGATVNMDGTALDQGVAAVFMAQVYGLPLTFIDQLTIVLTATMASIGTAAVPGAGLIMLVIVLNSVGVPVEGIALILGIDRLLDMCRTVVNVTGDALFAVIVADSEKELGVLQPALISTETVQSEPSGSERPSPDKAA